MLNIQSMLPWIYQLGKPWWSEWREIFTQEGVLNQSLIDTDNISLDKLKNEYILGRLGPEVIPEWMETIHGKYFL